MSGVLFLANSCFVMDNKYSGVAPGVWRATLQLVPREYAANSNNQIHSVRQLLTQKEGGEEQKLKVEEASEGELPFLFEVKYSNETAFGLEIINGDERIPVATEDIKIGRNKATGKDTILINFPVYGSFIRAIYQERVMEGEWIVPAKGLSIPFKAIYGKNHRFTTLAKKPTADLTGHWESKFDLADSLPYDAVGELKQNGNVLRGTFRTETGDYRFLDGEVQADKFYMSCFDGAHAFLFEGKIRPDGHLDGIFRSGKGSPEVWQAKKNEAFELRNANEITVQKNKNETIDFTFPNAEGKQIALKNYGNKVKIIQIMGTWCPNCRDETTFLTDYLTKHSSEKLAVIALAFERNADVAVPQVATYKNKMRVPYEILIAGTTNNKDAAAKTLPWLNKVVAFPTMIVLDKNNKVRRIHTGFDGPATSKYSDFVKEFDELINKVLSE